MRPGWRTEVRLRVEGPTTGDAKRALHALSSSLRACDGANGMRPVHVWRAQAFDDAIKERRPPG